MTQGASRPRSAGQAHSWPGHVAGIDGVAQGDIAVASRAYIADGGEPGFKRDPGVLGASQGFAWNGKAECLIAKLGIHGQMGMGVDQSRKDGCVGQIDAQRIDGRLCFGGGSDAHDLAIFDHDRLIGKQLAGLYVEHMPGMDHDAFGLCWAMVCPASRSRATSGIRER